MARALGAISGAFLILLGSALVVLEFFVKLNAQESKGAMRWLEASTNGISVQTTYIGFLIIVVGACLEAVAILAPSLHAWGRAEKKKAPGEVPPPGTLSIGAPPVSEQLAKG